MPIRVPLRLPVQKRRPPVVQPAIDSPRVIHGITTVPPGERPQYACDVVIPYYRGLRWLPQTIEAILTQNSVDCYVHLINDQSPEDDTEIRETFNNFSNLFWYRNEENIGPYRSYHQVWTRLKTDWFAVQDADDVPLPNRLWRALDALHSSGADIYGAAMEQMLSPDVPVDDDWNRRYVELVPIHSSGNASQSSPLGNVINGTMVCRRRTFERINGFAGQFTCSCDIEFITRAHFAGCRFYIDDSIVAIRRVHHTSLSRGGTYRLGTRAREVTFAEWQRRYVVYGEAKPEFEFAAYGALDEANPSLTVEVAND
jgi:glycosyltransferase involved in cell wall biosynthesis